MKGLGAVALLALCALPARGDQVALTQRVIDALTTMDAQPTRLSLDLVFSDQALANLIGIATNPAVDLGVQLQAIRALPSYCPQALDAASLVSCSAGDPHTTLRALLVNLTVPLDGSTADASPAGLLRLRAVVEALGATHSGDDADVVLLLPLLEHPNRDIRAATAYALRAVPAICNSAATNALSAHSRPLSDPSEQVQEACSAALRDLPICPHP